MKARATLQSLPAARGEEASLNDASVEAALRLEISKLGEWLAAQGLDVHRDQPRADEGSRDRLYFNYGYFTALKQALAMLTGHTQTLH
jgi:hypothetical protein